MSDQVVIQLRIGQAALDELSVPFEPVDNYEYESDEPRCALVRFPDGVYRLLVDSEQLINASTYKKLRKFHPGAPKGNKNA